MKSSMLSSPSKTSTFPLPKLLALILFTCILLYFLTSLTMVLTSSSCSNFMYSSRLSSPFPVGDIVFGLASTRTSWARQKEYLKLWWKPEEMRGCVFVDTLPTDHNNGSVDPGLPEVRVSEDTSQFRYTHKHGYRSLIRVARMITETVKLDYAEVKWYVFGDGDTVFMTDNLVKVLSKYNHELWYYVGTNSEIMEQNGANSFEMGFWGAGFAISAPLAKVLAKVFDSCLERYHHLYGSDSRIYSCLAELGVGLTHEPGFHQMDIRGNIFGLLAAHPLAPLVSLSRLSEVEPIFPNMTAINAAQHLFKAVVIDSERMLQQTVCYDRWFSWTISVSWGYAVEVFDHHIYLPDTLRVQDTFSPWKKGAAEPKYSFSTRPLHPDPCRRSSIFFFDRIYARKNTITSHYRRMTPENCTFDPMASPKKLQEIVVYSQKSNLGPNQLWAPRRQCCDVLPSSVGQKLELHIRECGEDELIRIHA
ncbi:hypothetical protein RND81_03G081200 [Saponaria officinalis]|uniref:Uncharacterized protein n=1 Tax=Saponaria officinalis TaxID=3572 RepID=A0AAW1M6S8_SAPOF